MVEGRLPEGDRLPRVGWFSPLLTAAPNSRAAYFTTLMLPELKKLCDLDLYSDRLEPGVKHFLSFRSEHDKAPYDIVVYQIENSITTHFCRIHLGSIPGMVIFHDINLTVSQPDSLCMSPWRHICDGVKELPARDFFNPKPGIYAERELSLSVTPVFLNGRNLSEHLAHTITATLHRNRPFELRYPVNEPAGIAQYSTNKKIGLVGNFEIKHRAHKILPVIRDLDLTLVWVLPSLKDLPYAKQLLAEFNVTKAELLTGNIFETWRKVQPDLFLATHLFFSAIGDAQPFVDISLMAGVPSVVLNFGAAEFFDNKAIIKIAPGTKEGIQLAAVIKTLSDKCTWEKISNASMHSAKEASVTAVASDIKLMLAQAAAGHASHDLSWRRVQTASREQVLEAMLASQGGGSLDLIDQRRIYEQILYPAGSGIIF